jgi:Domain of unknown function (DUF4314)
MEEMPVDADRVTVTDLLQHLEGCDPDAEVRLAQQPTWPFEYAIDPTTPPSKSTSTTAQWSTSAKAPSSATSPRSSASSSAGNQPPPQEPHVEFTPGERVELVATTDPYTRLRPGDRGTVTNVTDHPEPTIAVQWDDGSTLAILPHAGDRIRLLPRHQPDPPPSPPATSPPAPEDPAQPRYPDVQVQLSGEDGNAFAILGRTAAALRRGGVPQEEIDAYFAQATSGDYNHLLHTTMAWVDGQ